MRPTNTKAETDLESYDHHYVYLRQQPFEMSHVTEDTQKRLRQIVDELYPLDRDLVSSGYDEGLRRIARWIPVTTHRYVSDSTAWTWTIPHRWELRRGRIETINGQVVVDSANCSLHVARYSTPIDRVVSRDELLAHIFVHPVLPHAIPYQFFFYQSTWGFCLRHAERDALTDAQYRVVIDATQSPGTLSVGEVVVPGSSDESMLLIAHLDHPWQVNDDLSGVAVGIELMSRLRALPVSPKYTWRLLIVPETIGSVAWLAERPQEYASMHGGVFLEMLGLPFPHKVQRSFNANSHVNAVLESTFPSIDPDASFHRYRTVIGNDERQFNGPGVRIPCVSVSRVRQPVLISAARTEHEKLWPYDTYHSHLDDPAHCDFDALERSVEVLWKCLLNLEADAIVDAHFSGEIFLSKFGINEELEVSWYRDPVAYKTLFDAMDRIDGSRTISDIALEIGADFSSVLRIVEVLERHGLASRRATLPPRVRP